MKNLEYPIPWFKKYLEPLKDHPNHHAYLIGGREGLGKKLLALEIAKGLLCNDYLNSNYCNKCQSCKLFNDQNHPDFHLIKLEKEKKQISINQIRDQQERLYETSLLGNSKVFLINPAEGMTREASDSLLKALEEPPDNTFFLLISHRHVQLSPTIRSRCSLIILENPDLDVVTKWIETQVEDKNKVELATLLSKGRPLTSIELASKEVSTLRNSFIQDITKLIKEGNNFIDISNSWSKEPEEMILKLEWMSYLLMDTLRHKVLTDNDLTFEDTDNISSYLAEKVNFIDLLNLLKDTNTIWSIFYTGTNLRADYQLQSLFIDWSNRLGIASR